MTSIRPHGIWGRDLDSTYPIMEAAGFEPASRDASRQASTCIVVLFQISPPEAPDDRLPIRLVQCFLASTTQTIVSASLLFDVQIRPTGKAEKGRAAYLGSHAQLVVAN
jgi:hypothetical protein